jgi:hypothetical protein
VPQFTAPAVVSICIRTPLCFFLFFTVRVVLCCRLGANCSSSSICLSAVDHFRGSACTVTALALPCNTTAGKQRCKHAFFCSSLSLEGCSDVRLHTIGAGSALLCLGPVACRWVCDVAVGCVVYNSSDGRNWQLGSWREGWCVRRLARCLPLAADGCSSSGIKPTLVVFMRL